MRQFSLCVAAVLLAGAVTATSIQAAAAQPYEPDPASGNEVIVEGTSTMHGWEAKGGIIHGHLVLNEADLTSLWSNLSSPQKITPSIEVEIPVESLKSGNRAMDEKMHEALKASSNPVITYRLESAEIQPDQNVRKADAEGKASVETTGVLTVVGKSRRVEIPMQVRQLSNSKLEVSGETTLRMTDFEITPPKAMLGMLRTGNEVHVRWRWRLAPAAEVAAEPSVSQASLPVKADHLMPLKHTEGVYLVKEGLGKGGHVPFILEQHGDRWILTKRGLTWHELQRDGQGNILILREANLLKNQEVEYNPPVVLLPAVVDSNTSLSGKSRVVIKNAQSGSITYRGHCEWHLTFLGIESLKMANGTVPSYHLQMTYRIRLPLAQTSMKIDFDYAFGKGMVATAVEQMDRLFGLLKDRTIWRLEQIPASDEIQGHR